jgi:branched-chain amino acid transport system substrate-binding protein
MNRPGEPRDYYPTGTRNFFRLAAADDLEGAADAVLSHRLHLHRVYALFDGSDYGRATADDFARAAKKIGLFVAGSNAWNPALSPTRLAEAVKRSGATGVFLAGFAFDSGALIKALRRQVGKQLVLIGADGYLPISDVLKYAGPAAIGMYVSDSLTLYSDLNTVGKQLLHELQAGRPASSVLSGAYLPETAQLTQLVLDAIAHSNGTRPSILQALHRARIKAGPLGSFAFDANGDRTPAMFTIVRITGRRRAPAALIDDFRGSTLYEPILLPSTLTEP